VAGAATGRQRLRTACPLRVCPTAAHPPPPSHHRLCIASRLVGRSGLHCLHACLPARFIDFLFGCQGRTSTEHLTAPGASIIVISVSRTVHSRATASPTAVRSPPQSTCPFPAIPARASVITGLANHRHRRRACHNPLVAGTYRARLPLQRLCISASASGRLDACRYGFFRCSGCRRHSIVFACRPVLADNNSTFRLGILSAPPE